MYMFIDIYIHMYVTTYKYHTHRCARVQWKCQPCGGSTLKNHQPHSIRVVSNPDLLVCSSEGGKHELYQHWYYLAFGICKPQLHFHSSGSLAANLITSKAEHVESVIGNSLLAFCPGVELLTVINQRKKLMGFYWGKMCVVNENRTNLKTEAFCLEAPREIQLHGKG